MKNRMSVFLCAFLCVLTLTGCSKKTEDKKSDAFEPALDTTKEVVLTIQGGWDNFEALDAVETEFQKYYPNVSVSYTKLADFDTVLQNLGPSGDLDMLFNTKNGSTWSEGTSGELYEKYILNLNDEGLDFSNIIDSVVYSGQKNGGQYGIHTYQDVFGIIVNVDLLKADGFDVPDSYDEFIKICDAYSSRPEDEHAILVYYKQVGRLFSPFLFEKIINMDERDAVIENLNKGIAPESIFEGLKNLHDEWKNKGYFNSLSYSLEDNYNACIVEFFNGKIPFLICTTGTFSGCRKREAATVSSYAEHPFEYVFIPTPIGNNGETVMIVNTIGMFSILKNSKNRDYAVEFMRFLIRDENLGILSSVKGMPSSGKNIKSASFESFTKIKNENTYSYSTVGLSSSAYVKLRDTLDFLRKDDVTNSTLVEKYKEKMLPQ